MEMKKKWLAWLAASVLLSPILLIGGWKTYEWYSLYRLRNIEIPVAPYHKEIKSNEYDVIVVGGEPEGVAAAVAAARNGAKTLLIDDRDALGGLMTYGMLNFIDYDYDQYGKIANAGIFQEWHELVGGGVTFDIPTAKKAFLKLAQEEANLTLSLNTRLLRPLFSQDGRIAGVRVKDENGVHTYRAKRFIDATQNADLAAMAGAPYFIGGEDIGLKNRKMSTTLILHFKNVDWDGIVYTALTGKFGAARVTATAAWGFGEILNAYKPSQPDVRLRGLNIARQSDGSVCINALQIFNVDGLNPASLAKARAKGIKETEHILRFLRRHFPGFEKAQIASFPPELYVRETRHILAEYQLSIVDVWENRDQWDSIGFGSYPVDIQATSVHDSGFILADPVQYAIPFRSLVPQKVEGLLVAGKAAGYSSLAAGSARIIPTGMTTGQAAGVAAALSVEHEIGFHEMTKQRKWIQTLQQKLKAQGALLYPFALDYPYKGEWFYPAIRELLTYGLISGGHENRFPVDEPMNELSFVNLLSNGIQRKAPELFAELRENFTRIRYGADAKRPLTRDKALGFVLEAFGVKSAVSPWEFFVNGRFLDPVLEEKLSANKPLTTAESYMIAANVMERASALFRKGNEGNPSGD
ncbi:FAD-dependent oxidoreductase [Bacillaceae bacterium]